MNMENELTNNKNETNDTIPRIKMVLQTMSKNEEKVANYCISIGSLIQDKSIYDVAKENSVSASLVVKVAKRCGYIGFKDFKRALINASFSEYNGLSHELNKNDSPETVVQKIFSTAITGLRDTATVLDPKKLHNAANKLANAKKIDIYGAGGSGAVAMDLYHKFLRILVRCCVSTDSHMMAMSAVGLDTNSVAIGISHSGQSKSVLDALDLAKKNGAYVISITNSINSPIFLVADTCFCSVAKSSPIVGENAAARIAMLNIIDALFVLVAQKNYEKTLLGLEKTIESAKPLRIGYKS